MVYQDPDPRRWGGPQGVPIPMSQIKGQNDRPYFHAGPGFSHEGPAYECLLPHPGDRDWDGAELAPGEYIPRHKKSAVHTDCGCDSARALNNELYERHRCTEVCTCAGGPGWFAALTAPAEPPKVAPRSVLLWVGVDLDGTIAEPLWTPEHPTSEIGAPIWRNLGKLVELTEHGYKVVIHTARPWTDYEAIETWLEHYQIPWHQIQCGKPLFALYVDDRGRHSEEESWLP